MTAAPAEPRRILVLGTGAIGSTVAARLSTAPGCAVTIAGAWQEAIAAIAQDGIRLAENGLEWTARPEPRPLDEVEGAFDLVLVLVKSPQTETAAQVAARTRAPEGTVVTLQNGMGHRQTLEAAVGAGRVGVGTITVGATLLGPGRVRVTPAGHVVLGREPATASAVGALARAFAAASAPGAPWSVETTADVARVLWRKLAVNAAINPLTAVLHVTNGRLLDDAALRPVLDGAAREVGALAAAAGVHLDEDLAAAARDVAARTSSNRSSMLQDLENRRPTEIEAISGWVCREGRRLGVPTPVNERLYRAVQAAEEGGAAPIDLVAIVADRTS